MSGCYALPPTPVLPPHIDAAPEAVGTNVAMVIFGGATDISGSGLGVALRFEHQASEDVTLGLEVSGARLARGDVGGKASGTSEVSHTLVGVRAYGRYSVSDHFATTAGLGVSVLGTGLVTGLANTGVLVSRPSDTFVPLAAMDLALALPLHNVGFVAEEGSNAFNVRAEPALELELDLGAIVPIGSTGNRLSSNLGWVTAIPLADDDVDPIVYASFADAQRFR